MTFETAVMLLLVLIFCGFGCSIALAMGCCRDRKELPRGCYRCDRELQSDEQRICRACFAGLVERARKKAEQGD